MHNFKQFGVFLLDPASTILDASKEKASAGAAEQFAFSRRLRV